MWVGVGRYLCVLKLIIFPCQARMIDASTLELFLGLELVSLSLF